MKNKKVQSNLLISKITKLALVLVLALFSFFGGATLLLQNSTAAKLQNSTDSDQTVHAYDITDGVVNIHGSVDTLEQAYAEGYRDFLDTSGIYIDWGDSWTLPVDATLDSFDAGLDLTGIDFYCNGTLILRGGSWLTRVGTLTIGSTGAIYAEGGGVDTTQTINIYGEFYYDYNDAIKCSTCGNVYVYDGGALYFNQTYGNQFYMYGGEIHFEQYGHSDGDLFTNTSSYNLPLVYIDALPPYNEGIIIDTSYLTASSYEIIRYAKTLTYSQVTNKFSIDLSGSKTSQYQLNSTPVDNGDYYSLYLGELPSVTVTTETQLRDALNSGATDITLGATITISGVINVPTGVTITGTDYGLNIASTGVLNITGGSIVIPEGINVYGHLNMAGGSINADGSVVLYGNGPCLSLANIYGQPSIVGDGGDGSAGIEIYPSSGNSPYIYLASTVSNNFNIYLYTTYLVENDVASYQILKYASNVSQANAVKTNFTLTSEGYVWKTSSTATTDTDGSTCYAWEVEADYLVITYYKYNGTLVSSSMSDTPPTITTSGYTGRLRNTSAQYPSDLTKNAIKTKVYRSSVTATSITLRSGTADSCIALSEYTSSDTVDLTSTSQYREISYSWTATRGVKYINLYVYSTHEARFYSTTLNSTYAVKYFVYSVPHSMPTNPTNTGFSFAGWSWNTDNNPIWTSGTHQDWPNQSYAAFYAVWKKGWTFYDTSSSTVTDTTYYAYNVSPATQSYSKSNPSLSGKTFVGYSTGNDYTAEVAAGSGSTSVSSDSATPKFYAVWSDTSGTRNEYVTLTHRFYKTSSSDYTDKTTTKTIPYTGVTVYYNYSLSSSNPANSGGVAGTPTYSNLDYWTTTRSGFTFVGWADTDTDTAAD